eukprot:174045-Rhodomonas_salina.2
MGQPQTPPAQRLVRSLRSASTGELASFDLAFFRGLRLPLRHCDAKAGQDIAEECRHGVLAAVPGQAATEGDGARGKDGATPLDLEVDHVRAHEIRWLLARDRRQVRQDLLGDQHKRLGVLLRARDDPEVRRRPEPL